MKNGVKKLNIRHKLLGVTAALIASTIASFAPQTTYAMTVQPVVVDLRTAGRQMSALVTVENSFTTPLPVELKVREGRFEVNGLQQTETESNDLLVFPPQALIPPGQSQSFRIQWVGDPVVNGSKHYFITVAQLPVELPAGQNSIQILYNFQVIASVGANGAKPALRVLSTAIEKNQAGIARPVLELQNTGTNYGYLADGQVRIIQKDPSGREVFRKTYNSAEVQQNLGFGLVPAGQTRRMTLPVDLPSAEGTVNVEFTPPR
jgi:fimbrial chaperone protein